MNKSWIERLLGRPYFIYSFLTLFLFLGVLGYSRLDRKLFPDSNYPEIAVVIVQPGGSAKTIAANIAVPVEEELYTLDKVRRVYSTTIDEVSVIRAEFEYSRNLEMAASDVTTAIGKIRSSLPADILEPQIHKISSATAPVVVIAISPGDDSIPLEDIRQLADNTFKQELIKLPGVANVDVFGGYKKEIQVIVDKEKLDRYGLGIGQVLSVLQANNRDYAIGFLSSESSRYLLKSPGRAESIEGIRSLRLTPDVTLADVARVYFGHYENSASYFGNGREAIALAVQRGLDADVVRTIDRVEAELDRIRARYPGLHFEITDTQKDTIVQSTENMFESLRDAILMSIFVVFLFLASFRQVLVVLFTIPLVYAATVALMWLVGIEFNVVTLTGIILALGLLLDDAVVVMENIERHYRELGSEIHKAVMEGTREIMFADLSGTVTTMIALAPILFVGGYPQTVFRPLTSTLLLALAASYVISITAVPLLSLAILRLDYPWLLKAEAMFHRLTSRVNDGIQQFFASAVDLALRRRVVAVLYFIFLIGLFVVSVRGIMPIVGRELMPPMDTGGVQIKVTTDPNLPIEKSIQVAREVSRIVKKNGKLDRLSAAIGSEAGVLSIGSGSGSDHIAVTATYVNRYERDESVWEIERRLRKQLAGIENVKRVDVSDYGATALSSIRANIDIMLSAPDFEDLVQAGDRVEKVLYRTRGVVSVGRTWDIDKTVYNLEIDRERAALYGLRNSDITGQLQALLRGALVSSFPAANSSDFGVRVWLPASQRDRLELLSTILIDTPGGEKIPLGALATITRDFEPGVINREGLNYTLNVYGYREKAAISHIMDNFQENFTGTKLPPSVTLEQVGDIKEFKNSAGRMVTAIGFAVILIFFTLITFFDSVKVSLMIILSIPLTIIGASWTLLLLDYHVSMPAMMGFILLSGIIVNNAILLIHFAQEKMDEGMDRRAAMLESIRIRARPVLMTAFAVAVGMIPIALGSAIGLERLAPLGAVAIGGLLVGTFLTLLFIPLIFIWTTRKSAARGTPA
ncbi:multidrug ABC transporter [Desulfolithobacter dissulfuricans]|uniref:Multidrug ABC transporter n=1 Tax=Desulfolithobacter dissulfuricans TaxID=2795293 RepID=A0A915XLA6_9BACT|nr:efflux RND transporter permease subunit [Desulfolithobacter dissulfuricans]BCO10408.1 multidrug ABC transporter [Desulfolithobacter dissulfuricans]